MGVGVRIWTEMKDWMRAHFNGSRIMESIDCEDSPTQIHVYRYICIRQIGKHNNHISICKGL